MMLHFDSDYMETCHPLILEDLTRINLLKQSGYGTDDICKSAKDKIQKVCKSPNAEIYFLVGGTQTNATVLDGLLQKYESSFTGFFRIIFILNQVKMELNGQNSLKKFSKARDIKFSLKVLQIKSS